MREWKKAPVVRAQGEDKSTGNSPSGRTEGQEFQAGLKRSFLDKKCIIMEIAKDDFNFL